jgi:glycosyltransferase involved in cell wall biosynthesis
VRRLAIVSNVVPPSASGQAIVLAKVLGGRPPGSYVLVATRPQIGPVAGEPLPAPTELAPEPRFRSAVLNVILLPARVLVQAFRIARAVRAHAAEVVVGLTGDLWDLPAALIAARLAHARFVACLFDDYVHQWPNRVMRAVARRLEPIVLRHASAVLVTNEIFAESVRRRTGVTASIMRMPGAEVTRGDEPVQQGTIVYTGAVYAAHFDAFRNLLAAIDRLDANVTLHLHTGTTDEELAAAGISGRLVRHGHRSAAEVLVLQARADILFMPLAFEGPYHPELIRTSAPSKLGEYLAAGRPVLAHVQADSFVAWYLTRYDCGVVVSERDPAALAAALERLLHDGELRERLVRNARTRAAQDFALPVVWAAFAEAVDG